MGTRNVRLVVLTGAGISADSGLATFRGSDGLWEGHSIEEVATPEAWQRNPESVWRFYQLRRGQLGEVRPNSAHHGLVGLEEKLVAAGGDFLLVTQNVDDLHERAGSKPLHMHGELAVLRCERCGERSRDLVHVDPEESIACAVCKAERLRPDVVWFGEMPYQLEDIEQAVSNCSHFLSIGTSGTVYPAAGYLALARQVGAVTMVNSLDEPDNLHSADRFLPGRAQGVIPELCEDLAKQWNL